MHTSEHGGCTNTVKSLHWKLTLGEKQNQKKLAISGNHRTARVSIAPGFAIRRSTNWSIPPFPLSGRLVNVKSSYISLPLLWDQTVKYIKRFTSQIGVLCRQPTPRRYDLCRRLSHLLAGLDGESHDVRENGFVAPLTVCNWSICNQPVNDAFVTLHTAHRPLAPSRISHNAGMISSARCF